MSVTKNICMIAKCRTIWNRLLMQYKKVNWDTNGMMYEIVKGEWEPWGGMPNGELPDGWEFVDCRIPAGAPRGETKIKMMISLTHDQRIKLEMLSHQRGVTLSGVVESLIRDAEIMEAQP